MALSEAMERGTNFANFQTELFSQLEAFVGRGPEAIARADAQRLVIVAQEYEQLAVRTANREMVKK
jgi:hypothetical protein